MDLGASGSAFLRTQAFVMAVWIAGSGSEVATVMAVGGALLAAWHARRAFRDSDARAASAAQAALVLSAIGSHTPASLAGAVMLIAAMYLGSTLAGFGRDDIASMSLGAAPLGVALPGAALIAQAAFARIVPDRPSLAVAIPAAAALVWLAQAGVAGMRSSGERARTPWVVVPVLAVMAIVIFPGTVVVHGVAVAARAIGSARTLVPFAPAIPNDLGIVFAAAAIGAVVAPVRGRRRSTQPSIVMPDELGETYVPRAAIFFEIGAVGWWVALLGIAIHRGFL
jgi:hypothetical protein